MQIRYFWVSKLQEGCSGIIENTSDRRCVETTKRIPKTTAASADDLMVIVIVVDEFTIFRS
jgi:hypothetical protein